MKIIGLSCGAHDTAYCVFENGKVLLHEEYERFSRIKEQQGDVLSFLFDRQKNLEDVDIYTHFFMKWRGGLKNMYPESFNKLEEKLKNNNARYIEVSHHTAHAANAFFSSAFEKSIILSIDGGGEETDNGINKTHESSFCIFYGYKNKLKKIIDFGTSINIGHTWSKITKEVFKLSSGPPIGNQCGTVMAMAAVGKEFEKYNFDMMNCLKNQQTNKFEEWAQATEDEKFKIAASLQHCTEKLVLETIDPIFNKLIESEEVENVCVVGGVALNGLLNNKILNHFKKIKNIYIPPVPYDAGLAIGCCQYLYFHEYGNEREIKTENETPYLGVQYEKENILKTIEKNNLKIETTNDENVIELLDQQKIISIFNQKSESGRRALGNRSIFADPRNEKIKDILNLKIKHRQWYRPFAPIILKEYVSEWFEKDLESPYMNLILPFKKEKYNLVPAVVHFDGTGRVQTVKETDNEWLYKFLKKWNEKTNVPILLNTSFNDREPIVETPQDAINCFLKTKIDYLYFPEINILASK